MKKINLAFLILQISLLLYVLSSAAQIHSFSKVVESEKLEESCLSLSGGVVQVIYDKTQKTCMVQIRNKFGIYDKTFKWLNSYWIGEIEAKEYITFILN